MGYKDTVVEMLAIAFGALLVACVYLIPLVVATLVVKWVWSL